MHNLSLSIQLREWMAEVVSVMGDLMHAPLPCVARSCSSVQQRLQVKVLSHRSLIYAMIPERGLLLQTDRNSTWSHSRPLGLAVWDSVLARLLSVEEYLSKCSLRLR